MEYAITELKKKVENLEYKEIKPLKEQVSDVEKNLAVNNMLTEQCIRTNENLDKTLLSMRDAMSEISTSTKLQNSKVNEIDVKLDAMGTQFKEDVKNINERVASVDKRVTSVGQKGMVDTVSTIKNAIEKGIIWLIGGGGIVFLVNYLTNNMR